MSDVLKEIIRHIATPGDIAITWLAGIIGFVLEANLNVTENMEPGAVGVLSLAGALAVKRAVEIGLRRRRCKRLIECIDLQRGKLVRYNRGDLAEQLDRALVIHGLRGDDARLCGELKEIDDDFVRGRPVESQTATGR